MLPGHRFETSNTHGIEKTLPSSSSLNLLVIQRTFQPDFENFKLFCFLVQFNSSIKFHSFIADSKKEFSVFKKFPNSRSYTAASDFWFIIPISWLECKEEKWNLILVLTVLEGKLSLGQAHREIAEQSTILSTPTFIAGLDPEGIFTAALNRFIKGRTSAA